MVYGDCWDTIRSVPPRCEGARAPTVTHSVSPAAARAEGALPTAMVLVSRVAVSMREIEPSNSLATHTASPATITPLGPRPAGKVVTTFVSRSIFETVPSRRLATHTPSGRTASPAGPLPTLCVWTTAIVSGEILDTVAPAEFVIRRASPPPRSRWARRPRTRSS